jgi:hypothetical protein
LRELVNSVIPVVAVQQTAAPRLVSQVRAFGQRRGVGQEILPHPDADRSHVALQLVGLGLCIAFPEIVLWLPRALLQ